jgi:hypothetical protein
MTQQFLCSEDNKTIFAWPYCQTCHQPYSFEPEEPFAYCDCGTSEWGSPRPASWIPDPSDSFEALADRFKKWHDSVMPDETPGAILRHLEDEVHELIAEEVIEEAVDVQLVLLAWVIRSGFNLGGWIIGMRHKMAINEHRTWIKTKHGDYRHIEPRE